MYLVQCGVRRKSSGINGGDDVLAVLRTAASPCLSLEGETTRPAVSRLGKSCP